MLESGRGFLPKLDLQNDVEEVILGDTGVLRHAAKGSYIIDMTNLTPALAEHIHLMATQQGIKALDGDVGADKGNLATMAAGDEKAYAKIGAPVGPDGR